MPPTMSGSLEIRPQIIEPPVGPMIEDAEGLSGLYDMTRDDLGVKLLEITLDWIILYTEHQTDPDEIPWNALNPIYEAEKAEVVPGEPIGVYWGLMLDRRELEGERKITPEEASMTYGTDELAKIEATKFQEGGIVTGTNQPPRPFYAIPLRALDFIEWTLKEHLTDANFASS